MICASVIFESAGYYLRHHNYQRKVREIVLSKEVDNLLRCLRWFKESESVRDVLEIADKLRSKLLG